MHDRDPCDARRNPAFGRLVAVVLLLSGIGEIRDAVAKDAAEDFRQLADCYRLAHTDAVEARRFAQRWLAKEGSTAARRCLAAAELAAGRYAEAASILRAVAAEPAVMLHPRARVALLAQSAEASLLAGDAAAAQRALDEAVVIAPDDAELRIDRAMAAAHLGQYGEAIKDLTVAIEREPLAADPYVLRASALRHIGALDRAAVDLDIAMQLDPRHPEALLERGLLRERAGDTAGAHADWWRLLEVAPGSEAAVVAREKLGLAVQPGG